MKLKLYVDGSFNEENQEVSSGIIILDSNDKPIRAHRVVTREKGFTESRNVSGELLAVIIGLSSLQNILTGQRCEVIIFYDYMGIEKWVAQNNRWKAKTTISKIYVEFMDKFLKNNPWISLRFTKVKAHSGVKWNVCVDKLSRGEVVAELEDVMLPTLMH